jgi:hypothetical protein
MELTQPHTGWLSGLSGLGVKLTTNFYLVPNLRKIGTENLIPPHAFTACRRALLYFVIYVLFKLLRCCQYISEKKLLYETASIC